MFRRRATLLCMLYRRHTIKFTVICLLLMLVSHMVFIQYANSIMKDFIQGNSDSSNLFSEVGDDDMLQAMEYLAENIKITYSYAGAADFDKGQNSPINFEAYINGKNFQRKLPIDEEDDGLLAFTNKQKQKKDDRVLPQSNQNVPMSERHGLDRVENKLKPKVQYRYRTRPDIIKLIVTNTGSSNIKTFKWDIYFSHMSKITEIVPCRYISNQIEEVFEIQAVTENMYRIEPLPTLKTMEPGKALYVFYKATVPAHRFDVFPNWYLTAPGTPPMVIRSTAGESLSFVDLFNGPEAVQIVHQGGLQSSESRYKEIKVRDSGGAPNAILPTPYYTSTPDTITRVTISRSWKVAYDRPEIAKEAVYIADALKLDIFLCDSESKLANVIRLKFGAISLRDIMDPPEKYSSYYSEESYELNVHSDMDLIDITAPSRAGLFYGIQSLLALINTSESNSLNMYVVPVINIIDIPRMEYRGLMLDVARNFFGVNEIKKVIRLLGRYKMNRLHLHLTDSQGWRIEIPGLPELTQFGGRRGHDLNETEHLMSNFGSGPDENGRACGFYTVDDYREILKYAQRHHVEIIPEIDLPGHSRAAIQAMLIRYVKYASSDKGKAQKFLLTSTRKGPRLGRHLQDDLVEIHRRSTSRFVEHVVTSLVNMHKDIMPLRSIHLGGDEVPGITPLEQMFFTERFIDIALKHNLSLHLWQDNIVPHLARVWPKHQQNTSNRKGANRKHSPRRNMSAECEDTSGGPSVVYQHWKSGDPLQCLRLLEILSKCYKVIHSASTRLYLDQPQDTHPDTRGNMWAAEKIDSRDVLSYTPDFPLDNIVPGEGEDMETHTMRDFCDTEMDAISERFCKDLPNPHNNYGMEVAVWTELVRTPDQLFTMLLPRLLAGAERAWHRADWEWNSNVTQRSRLRLLDWHNFINTLGYRELAKLEQLGYTYFIPSPGAVYNGTTLLLRSEIPGFPFEMSIDQSTWTELQGLKVENIGPYNHIYIRIRSPGGKIYSRVVTVINVS